MQLLHEACQRGVAAVVVTHDAQLASWADRVMFLRDGRVTGQTAPPAGPGVAAHDRGSGREHGHCHEPPDLAGAGHGSLVARRAVIRWAWRLSRREWRQQILVVALLAVAVAGTIVGVAAAASAPADLNAATHGTASSAGSSCQAPIRTWPPTSPRSAAAQDGPGRGDRERKAVAVPGSVRHRRPAGAGPGRPLRAPDAGAGVRALSPRAGRGRGDQRGGRPSSACGPAARGRWTAGRCA